MFKIKKRQNKLLDALANVSVAAFQAVDVTITESDLWPFPSPRCDP